MKNMSGSMNEKNVSQKHVALTYIRDYRVMTNLKYRKSLCQIKILS
jgi:hypothetical protein